MINLLYIFFLFILGGGRRGVAKKRPLPTPPPNSDWAKELKMSASLESLKFDNLALKALPIDSEEENYIRQVSGACFSIVGPTPVEKPQMVLYSVNCLSRLLDLSESQMKRQDFAEYFSGNRLLPGSQPAAHCYSGHQQGYFSGQLGDGAAV